MQLDPVPREGHHGRFIPAWQQQQQQNYPTLASHFPSVRPNSLSQPSASSQACAGELQIPNAQALARQHRPHRGSRQKTRIRLNCWEGANKNILLEQRTQPHQRTIASDHH